MNSEPENPTPADGLAPPPASAVSDDAVPPGAQRERTALAWQRTLLGAALGGLVLAMTSARAGVPVVDGASALLTIYVALRLVHRGPAHSLRGELPVLTRDSLLRIVSVVVALGLLGAATAVVGAVRSVS